MSGARRVIVVGGNIAGLGLALALKRLGLDPVVLERMPSRVDVGGGLHIWTNGAKALRWLGVDETLRAVGTNVERLEFRTRGGAVIMTAPLGDFGRRYGDAAFFIPRVALPRTLLEALGTDSVEFGAECVGYEQRDGGVTARVADGREFHGDVLVGADGIRSGVRAQLVGDVQPRHAGYQDWGAIVQIDGLEVPPGVFWTIFGSGARAGIAHVGPGLVYWATSIRRPLAAPAPPIRELQARFADWPEALRVLIDATPPEVFYGADIFELPKLSRWTDRRVALIGDGAHAMQPGAGRGASEGLVDAVTLARTLASLDGLEDGTSVASALKKWERSRRRDTEPIVKRSRQIGELGMWQGRTAMRARRVYIGAIGRFVIRSMEKDFRAEI
ncbi:MAG: FAD-dependent monooxygenase [Gaiellaceae bacterium]